MVAGELGGAGNGIIVEGTVHVAEGISGVGPNGVVLQGRVE